MAAGQAKGWGEAPGFGEFNARIEGLKAELDQREKKLTKIMEGGEKKAAKEKPDKGGKEAAHSKANK
jgi:hypothetical protein